MIPQIIVLVMVVFGLGFKASKNGEPTGDTYNFWGSVLNYSITLFLMYWGGFFDPLFK